LAKDGYKNLWRCRPLQWHPSMTPFVTEKEGRKIREKEKNVVRMWKERITRTERLSASKVVVLFGNKFCLQTVVFLSLCSVQSVSTGVASPRIGNETEHPYVPPEHHDRPSNARRSKVLPVLN
jgi:hypothetical protein